MAVAVKKTLKSFFIRLVTKPTERFPRFGGQIKINVQLIVPLIIHSQISMTIKTLIPVKSDIDQIVS